VGAGKVQQVGKGLGLVVQIKPIENPGIEAEYHYYNPAHTGLMELGLKPHYLTDDVLAQMIETAMRYKENIREEAIFRGVKWK